MIEIEINGIIWRVQFVKPSDTRLLMPTGYTIGVTDLDVHKIYISNNLTDEMLERCVLHELCHAIIYSYGLPIDVQDEECVCQVMEVFSDDVEDLADQIYEQLTIFE